jgi:hypothetical protein
LEILSRNQSQVDDAEVLGELRRGEQLTAGDIELAMDDPDIRPVPLHGVEKTSRPSVQLYFGPGFEERLELELEECVIWPCPSLFDLLTVVHQYKVLTFHLFRSLYLQTGRSGQTRSYLRRRTADTAERIGVVCRAGQPPRSP